ncbi:hypothetical protein KIS4809_5691 [Bacillus sp. ZZV12-4809]|jgi:hypothetical protein|nr:hypothetical protein KIS4809_5691 [Bacillus sp. ZZV12-4809]
MNQTHGSRDLYEQIQAQEKVLEELKTVLKQQDQRLLEVLEQVQAQNVTENSIPPSNGNPLKAFIENMDLEKLTRIAIFAMDLFKDHEKD